MSTNIDLGVKERIRKNAHIVWKVDKNGLVVLEMPLTDAGRYVIAAMPPALQEQWRENGSYQQIIKKVLNKNVMVDDALNTVEDNGFFWMTKPPHPLCVRLHTHKRLKERYQMMLLEKQLEADREIRAVREENTRLQQALTQIDKYKRVLKLLNSTVQELGIVQDEM